MLIRPYSEGDFEGIKKVIQNIQSEECWPHYYPNGWDEERIRQEFNPVLNYKHPLFLVSEENHEITGLIAGHDLESFVDNEISHLKNKFHEFDLLSETFYQRDIIVDKKHQRGTLGLRLFRELQKHASESGYSKLVTRTPPLNVRGRTFFNKIGYEEIFEDDNPSRIYFAMKL